MNIDLAVEYRPIQNNSFPTIGVWYLGVAIRTRSSDVLFDEEVSKEMGIWQVSVTNAKNFMSFLTKRSDPKSL